MCITLSIGIHIYIYIYIYVERDTSLKSSTDELSNMLTQEHRYTTNLLV